MAGAQAILEAAAAVPPEASAAAASSHTEATPLLVVIGTLVLAAVLAWAVPLLLGAQRQARRLASEEERALEAVRKRLAVVEREQEPAGEPIIEARVEPPAPSAADHHHGGGDDGDDPADSNITPGITAGENVEPAPDLDPVMARQLRLEALARRQRPAKTTTKTAAAAAPAAATAAAAVPDNPLSPGAVETAAKFPFLKAWQAETRAALREALNAAPKPSAELRERLRRLLTHVIEHPHDHRYRSFRRGNPAFAALWGPGGNEEAPPGPFHALLHKLGFTETRGHEGDGDDDDAVVVALATEPTAAHLEVMRGLVAVLHSSSSSFLPTLPHPPLPPALAAATPTVPAYDEAALTCHVCGEGGLFVDRQTARPDVLFRAGHRRAAVHCADCGGGGPFVLCGGCYNAGHTGGDAHAGHRFLLLPPPEGWEAVVAEGNTGGWGAEGGGGGWRKSAPVPRDRRPGRGPWG